jgi:hypothetical protein
VALAETEKGKHMTMYVVDLMALWLCLSLHELMPRVTFLEMFRESTVSCKRNLGYFLGALGHRNKVIAVDSIVVLSIPIPPGRNPDTVPTLSYEYTNGSTLPKPVYHARTLQVDSVRCGCRCAALKAWVGMGEAWSEAQRRRWIRTCLSRLGVLH